MIQIMNSLELYFIKHGGNIMGTKVPYYLEDKLYDKYYKYNARKAVKLLSIISLLLFGGN